jgi:hypothetical protein
VELLPGKLTHPAWPSWLEVFVIALGWLEQLKMERRRKSTVVLYNVIEEILNRGKWLLDDRHAWEIASELGFTRKWVRESLCALESDGVVFRLHMVGHSSKHGLTSNVLVFPQLLVLCLDLIPRGARAATIQFLRRADVRAQLEAGGVWARLPEAVTGVALTVRPTSGITGTVPGDTASQGSTIVSSVGDRRSGSPTPRAVDDVDESAGGAVAPSPHIAPSAASTVPEEPSCVTPPPAAGERQNGPRLVTPSPAPLVNETRPSTVPPATRPAAMAGSRSEVRPTLPEHLQGLQVPFRDVFEWFLANHPGMSRGKAWKCVEDCRRSLAWRAKRDERGEPPGRQPRWRGAAKERDRTQRAARLAVVDEGKRGLSTWTKLRGEIANRATEAEWCDLLAKVECRAERLGGPGLIILDLDGPKGARDRVARIAATMPGRVQIAWPQPAPPPVVAEVDRWPIILGSWARPGDTVWAHWLASLRLLGWAQEDGALIVRVTADMDVLARLRFYRDGLDARATKALRVPVRVSLEPS